MVYVHWITGLKNFACTSGLRSIRACLMLMNPPQCYRPSNRCGRKVVGNSLWTRTRRYEGCRHGTEGLSEHQRSMRRLSGELFASRTRSFMDIDCLAKIDTQLHTEAKVEEIFKVFSL